jgi:hypothetical protein
VTKVIAPISRDADTPVYVSCSCPAHPLHAIRCSHVPFVGWGLGCSSFLLADAQSALCVVSIYNVTSDVLNGIKASDSLIIVEPHLKLISLKSEKVGIGQPSSTSRLPLHPNNVLCCGVVWQGASYKCVHVTNPFNFFVNGRRLHT